MKFKFLLTFLVFFLAFSSSYASFPVKRATTTVAANNANLEASSDEVNNNAFYSPAVAVAGKTMITALLLWFFLGGFAAHRWYLGSPWYWNVLYIITLGGLFVWAIIDLIDIITENYPGL